MMDHHKESGNKNTFYKMYYSKNKPNADLKLMMQRKKIKDKV